MGQHPDPDDFHDQDLDDNLDQDLDDNFDQDLDDNFDQDLDDNFGRPLYQGDGLTVRELSAEELQRFLDAHAGQPARLLGSGWAALDPPGHPYGIPRTPPGLSLSPPDLRRRSRPERSPPATAAPAAPPWPSIGAGARSS